MTKTIYISGPITDLTTGQPREGCDIPEGKLKTAKRLLMPLKDYLLREDF